MNEDRPLYDMLLNLGFLGLSAYLSWLMLDERRMQRFIGGVAGVSEQVGSVASRHLSWLPPSRAWLWSEVEMKHLHARLEQLRTRVQAGAFADDREAEAEA